MCEFDTHLYMLEDSSFGPILFVVPHSYVLRIFGHVSCYVPFVFGSQAVGTMYVVIYESAVGEGLEDKSQLVPLECRCTRITQRYV